MPNNQAMTLDEARWLIAEKLEAQCQKCNGSGEIDSYPNFTKPRFTKCSDCSGTGKVYPYRKPCPMCKGDKTAWFEVKRDKNGEVISREPLQPFDPCKNCQGKGYVPKEPWELAEALAKNGWAVIQHYYPFGGRVADLYFGGERVAILEGKDAHLTLHLATVQALGIGVTNG